MSRPPNPLRKALFDRVMSMSPAYFEKILTGEVLSRITTDTTLILSVIGSSVSVALRNLIMGTLGIGYRKDWYALELAPTFVKFDTTDYLGGGVNALIFPLKSIPNLYGVAGFSILQYRSFPTTIGNKDFNTLNLEGGLGYIQPLQIGRYAFGIRAEARYRYGNREREFNDQDVDLSAPKRYKQTLIHIGLHLPLNLKTYVAAPPPEPTPEVVPVEPPKDDDQDGVFNDIDKCPDSPAGSVVDETGCPPPPPPPPPKTCKTPGPGEKISLAGCGTGDNIVLRGVNFDTNKATLTRNAKVLLDDVAAELNQYQDIKVQVGGHTDSRGSAALNDGLSKRRAASVMAYLTAKGIAANRMTSAGFGPNEPIADNATAEGQELNRRVELKIVSGNATPAEAQAAATEAAVDVAPDAEVAPAEDAPAAE